MTKVPLRLATTVFMKSFYLSFTSHSSSDLPPIVYSSFLSLFYSFFLFWPLKNTSLQDHFLSTVQRDALLSENTSWGNHPLWSAVRELLLIPIFLFGNATPTAFSTLLQGYLVVMKVPSNPYHMGLRRLEIYMACKGEAKGTAPQTIVPLFNDIAHRLLLKVIPPAGNLADIVRDQPTRHYCLPNTPI